MIKKLGELKIDKFADYYDKVAETLEKAGFVLVLELETISDRFFIVASKEEEE